MRFTFPPYNYCFPHPNPHKSAGGVSVVSPRPSRLLINSTSAFSILFYRKLKTENCIPYPSPSTNNL
jgi:hypothetical protein